MAVWIGILGFHIIFSIDRTRPRIRQNVHNLLNVHLGKTNVRRVNHANYHRGLSVLIDVKPDDYFITSDDFEGFKLLVHDPSAYPELQSKALAIGSGEEVFVTTKAAHTDA